MYLSFILRHLGSALLLMVFYLELGKVYTNFILLRLFKSVIYLDFVLVMVGSRNPTWFPPYRYLIAPSRPFCLSLNVTSFLTTLLRILTQCFICLWQNWSQFVIFKTFLSLLFLKIYPTNVNFLRAGKMSVLFTTISSQLTVPCT